MNSFGGKAGYNIYSQGSKTGVLDAIPRNKFNFTVSLTRVDTPAPLVLERIANIQMPTFTYRTQTLNKYNNKSIVQTGIDYTPITLTAYDTKDAVFETFLKDYARHYFAGPMNDEDYGTWLTSPKGLELPLTKKPYITTIKIVREDATGLTNEIEIFNAFIQNVDTDTLDYSDSGASIIRVTFGYEGYRISSTGTVVPPVTQSENMVVPLENGFTDDFDEAEQQYLKQFDVIPETNNVGVGKNKITTNQPQYEEFIMSEDAGADAMATNSRAKPVQNLDKLITVGNKKYVVRAPVPGDIDSGGWQ